MGVTELLGPTHWLDSRIDDQPVRQAPVVDQACWISFQVTAWLRYGGMVLPLAIGAVVDGVPITCQMPLSGQVCPVRAVVPSGARVRRFIADLLKVIGDGDRPCTWTGRATWSPLLSN